MNELPIYKISIDDIFEEGGLDYVSLVADPAIQMKGLAFSSVEDLFTFKFNADKQIIAGPALIPDKLIYREDPDLGQFYVVFDAITIERLVAKFNKTPKEFKVNVDHSTVVPSAYIFSNWIITDSQNDKSNSYGFNLPEGTWFAEVKIDDTEFWNTEIKANAKFGFSVEGLFGLKLNNNKIQKQEEMTNKLKFAEEEAAVETVAEAVPAIDEAKIMELVQPKLDELYAAIAELKTMIETAEVEDEVMDLKETKLSKTKAVLAMVNQLKK